MKLFDRKKKAVPTIDYNPNKQRAILRCSICNGEQVAGFKDKQTGQFTEVMLIRNEKGEELSMAERLSRYQQQLLALAE